MIGRRAVLAAPVVLTGVGTAAQEAWPSRPVRIVVPSSPGDGGDSIARLYAAKLQEAFGQPFPVENRTGAGGRIGTEFAARAAPDGYTLIMGNAGSHGINGAVYRTLTYDLVRDFQPISLLVEAPNVLVVNRKVLDVGSVAELIAYAKARPGQLDYASGGVGTSAHLSMELFKSMAGLDMLHVPFRGAANGLQALVSGTPPVMFVNLPPAMAIIQRGELHALAVTSMERTSDLPDTPTVNESGLPGFETIAWFGLLAPTGTPRPVVDRLHAACVTIAKMPDVVAPVRKIGGFPRATTPEQFHERVRNDVAKWQRLVAEKNLALE